MKKQFANFVTGIRILCSLWLLTLPVFSAGFYGVYLLCGITDMVDGTIARKTNTVSRFGEKLDSVADLVFLVAAAAKLLPAVELSARLWIGILIVFLLRITNLIRGWVITKKILPEHTVLNKITGLLLFVLPLTMPFAELEYTAWPVFVLAAISTIREGYAIRKGTHG